MKLSLKKQFFATTLAVSLLAVLGFFSAQSDDNLPQKPSDEMLSSVWQNSPYKRGIASDSSSTQYALAGIFSIGSQDFVSVLNRTTTERFTLSKAPNKNNAKLIDLHFSSNLREAYATVEIEGTQYKIKYDQTLLAETPVLPTDTNSAATNFFRRNFPGGVPPWMTNNGGQPPRFFRRQRPIDNTNLQ